MEMYPKIGLDSSKFMQWENKEIRRAFLDKVARVLKFDPLVLENWQRVSESQLQSFVVRSFIFISFHYFFIIEFFF